MSGHSKWSTIKRQKGINDQARGQLFSKLGKAISVAAKTGGGPNIDSNFKLKIAVDQAKAQNMPKVNIDRAIKKASGPGGELIEVTYEGFGPEGVNLMITTATDNRNRTGQEIKNILERGGGSMGGPGASSFNFEPRGYILVEKNSDSSEQLLAFIDMGVIDGEEIEEGLEVYTEPKELFEIRNKIEKSGSKVLESKLIQYPKTLVPVKSEEKLYKLLTALESQEDVQPVFANEDS